MFPSLWKYQRIASRIVKRNPLAPKDAALDQAIHGRGIAPISVAAIWSVQQRYLPVEWVVLAVSLMSAVAFAFAVYFARGVHAPKHAHSQSAVSAE